MLPSSDQQVARCTRGESAVGAIAKTDSAVLDLSNHPCRAVWVGGTGTLVCTFVDGTVATLSGIPAGTLLPLSLSSIAASSTATNVVALL